jgi:hypothetical protein
MCRAAVQWHASRYVSHRTKGIDLAGLIVYNLSNWTGLAERAMPQGLPFVIDAIRCGESAPTPCGDAPKPVADAPVSCRFTERSETNECGIRSIEARRTDNVDQGRRQAVVG